ncbi:MAG: MATE family efflux transporter [Bacteroidota bacterium]
MWRLIRISMGGIGQNLGAKKPKRAERSVWATAWANMILLAFVGVVLLLFSDFFIRLFIDDAMVIETGVFAAIVAAETAMTLVAWMLFRRGKWKLKEV